MKTDPTDDLFADPAALLQDLLATSLTAVNLLRPLYGPDGTALVDFAVEYLNPAARRITGLPERPDISARARFPDIFTNGVFDFYRRVFETGEPGRYDFNYQADGFDNYFHVAARRSGALLIVSFTDTADHDRSAVEVALRQSQAAERAARAEAEAQQRMTQSTFTQIFAAIPAAICLLRGPAHRYEYTNAAYEQLFPGRQLLGRTVAEVLPETVEAGFVALLDRVYQTGETFFGHEMPLVVTRPDGHPLWQLYFTFTYQAYRENGEIVGISVFGLDVSAQVSARQRQQEQLHELFAQAPVALAVFRGPRYVIEIANPAVCAMWGRTMAQAVGTPLFELLPEAAGQGFEELLDGVLATGVPFVAHELPSLIDRGGRRETVYWNFVYQPLREASGHITAITVVATDVTEQVQARRQAEALHADQLASARREARMREEFYQIFAQTPAAIVVLRGPEHRYEYFNAAYEALFPGRDLPGRSVAEALPEAEAQGFVALLDRVYQTGETYYGTELPLTTAQPNGAPPRETFFNLTYQALREDGQVTGISVFAYDVTEQVLARQERERQRRHLEELFEQAPVAFAVFRGPDHTVELANEAACAMWGRTRAQVLHRSILAVLPELAGQGIRELLDGVTATGVPFVDPELRVELNRHGRRDTVYFNLLYQPLLASDGRIDGLTVIAADVSEQVQARQQVQALNKELAGSNQSLHHRNEELRDANRQLTRTNVDLDNFIYTASHDLKQPISNIEGLLDALREHLPPEAYEEPLVPHMLGLMREDVERFQLTIHQLTHLTRLQAAHDAPAEAVDLAAVVEAVRLDVAAPLAGAQLTVAIPPGLRVHFPPHNLRSVVYNLLSNALKYRHPDRPPVVALRAYAAGQSVVLEVQDNGLGLNAAQQSQLFGLFRRLHTHVEGTGMGLYIIKRMVENAGGTIAVQSQAGAGSTFTVTFPA